MTIFNAVVNNWPHINKIKTQQAIERAIPGVFNEESRRRTKITGIALQISKLKLQLGGPYRSQN